MTAIVPLYLQALMGYTALQSGLAMVPRGLGAMVAMPLAGRLVSKVQGRYLVAVGFLTFAIVLVRHEQNNDGHFPFEFILAAIS